MSVLNFGIFLINSTVIFLLVQNVAAQQPGENSDPTASKVIEEKVSSETTKASETEFVEEPKFSNDQGAPQEQVLVKETDDPESESLNESEISESSFEAVDSLETVSTGEIFSENQPRARRVELALGVENRFEAGVADEELNPVSSLRFQAGYIVSDWLLSLQYGSFSEETDEGSLSIKEDRRELLFQGSYLAQRRKWWGPVFGLGAGLYQERIETQLSQFDANTSTSDLLMIGQLFVGWRMNFDIFGLQIQGQGSKRDTVADIEYSILTQVSVRL